MSPLSSPKSRIFFNPIDSTFIATPKRKNVEDIAAKFAVAKDAGGRMGYSEEKINQELEKIMLMAKMFS